MATDPEYAARIRRHSRESQARRRAAVLKGRMTMCKQDEPPYPEASGPKPALKLTGTDANAFSVLGRAGRALREAGRSSEVEAYVAEATDGDYEHLLAVTLRWFDVT